MKRLVCTFYQILALLKQTRKIIKRNGSLFFQFLYKKHTKRYQITIIQQRISNLRNRASSFQPRIYIIHPPSSILRKTILLIFLLPSWLAAQNLDAYKHIAAENNPGLKAKYIEFEMALQRVPQVGALPDPTVSFGYFVQPVETRIGAQRARIELTQMFPWFGTLAAQKDAASRLADAKYQAFLDAKNALFFNVVAAYYPLYEVDEMLRLLNENLEILQSYKQLAITAFSNAKGSLVDVLRTDIMIDEAKTNIALLQNKRIPLLTVFNKLLNRPETIPIDIAAHVVIDSTNSPASKDTLFQNNPQLKAFDLKLQAAQALEKAAFRKGLPSFGVGLSYTMVDERTDVNIADNGNDALMPMISMSIPLYRKKYNAAVKEAQLQQTSLTQQKQDMENQLVSLFERLIFQMKSASQNFVLFNRQIAKTQQVIDLLRTAFSHSGKGFEDVLRMQQQLLKYQMAQATAVKEFYTAEAEIAYLNGK